MSVLDSTSYREISQGLDTLPGNILNNNEFRILRFIFNRTIRYDKACDRMPYRHFTEGVYAKTGRLVAGNVPGDKRTVRRTLESLEKKGLIAREIGDDFSGSTFITFLVDKVMEFVQMALNISKRFKKGGVTEHQRWGAQNTSVK